MPGVDGVLVLDLPVEEAGPFRERLVGAALDPIFLLSPTTTRTRGSAPSSDLGSGFLYVISRLGVTGARDQVATDAESLVAPDPGADAACRWRWGSGSRLRNRSPRSAAGPTRRWSGARSSMSLRNTAPRPTWPGAPAPTCAG